MTTFGIDGSDRANLDVGLLSVTIGPLPFGKGEELIMAWNATLHPRDVYLMTRHGEWYREAQAKLKADPTAEIAYPDDPGIQAAVDSAKSERLRVALELAQWSLKEWKIAPPRTIKPLAMTKATYAGQSYEIASKEQLQQLARHDGGATLIAVASLIVDREQLSAREALGFT